MTRETTHAKDDSKHASEEQFAQKSDSSFSPALSNTFASFKHVCESRDGKLCLFEDSLGHLIAVRSSRLA